MFHRFQRFFTQLKILLDLLVLAAAFGLAYTVRFWSPHFLPYEGRSPWNNTVRILATIGVLYPLAIHSSGLYRAARIRSFLDDVFGLFKAWLLASMGLVTVTYFFQPVRYSRLVLASSSSCLWSCWCSSATPSAARCRPSGAAATTPRTCSSSGPALSASGCSARCTITASSAFEWWACCRATRRRWGRSSREPRSSAGLEDLERVMASNRVDQVVIALPLEEQGALRGMMAVLSESTADVKIVPDLVAVRHALRAGVEEFGGLPLLSLQHGPLEGWNGVIKRLFDIVFSALALARRVCR